VNQQTNQSINQSVICGDTQSQGRVKAGSGGPPKIWS